MKRIGAVLLLVISVFCLFVAPVFADEEDTAHVCQICGETHDLSQLSFTNKIAYEMSERIYGGGYMEVTSGDSSVSTSDVLRFDTKNTVFADLWNRVGRYYDQFVIVGQILLLVFAMTDLFKYLSSPNITVEVIFKLLMKYVIGFVVLSYLWKIVTFILMLSSEVFSKLASITSLNYQVIANKCPYATSVKNDIFDGFIAIGDLFLPYVIMWLAKLMTIILCWARILELCARTIFAPIGAADLIATGTQGSGYRYLKKLLAVAIQGSAILAIFYINSILMASLTVGSGQGANYYINYSGVFISVVLSIVSLLSVVKVSSVINDVFNV